MRISRRHSASAPRSRAETGSSYQNGSNGSSMRATRTACIGRQPAVHLDQQIDLGADRLAHGAHVLDRLLLDLA